MERILRGKFLVKKNTMQDGKSVLTITGVFHPLTFSVDDINDDDEMWVSDIIISGGLKFTEPIGLDGGSPEDFLSGNNQSPSNWKNKTTL